MEINSIPQFPEPANTTINRSLPVFDPARDAQPWWSAPSPEWASAIESVAPNVNKMLQEQSRSRETWEDTLKRMLPVIAATAQQREILKIQLKRAENGLDPLPNSEFGAQVSVGLDASTRNVLLIGGAALIGLLAWRLFKR